MRRLQRLLWGSVIVVVVFLLTVGVVGHQLFGVPHEDPLRKVDAILVLGGEHDGREAYGVQLAEAGYANTVVMSNPYRPDDHVMSGFCGRSFGEITVTCEVPNPSTTRGEAIIAQRLSQEHGWKSMIVISWGYHLTRAKYIFDKCYSGETVMQAVPRHYDYGPADWELIYLYQSIGTLKAMVQGECG